MLQASVKNSPAASKPAHKVPNKSNNPNLEKFIPLLCYFKDDSVKMKANPVFHKKSFSVSQQKFKGPEHAGPRPKKVSGKVELRSDSQQREERSLNPEDRDSSLNKKAGHSRVKSSYGDAIAKYALNVGGKPALRIREKHKAGVAKHSHVLKKDSATAPPSPLKQHRVEPNKSKASLVNCTCYEQSSKSKTGTQKVSGKSSVVYHKRVGSDGGKVFQESVKKNGANERPKTATELGKKRQSADRLVTNKSNDASKVNRCLMGSDHSLTLKRGSVPISIKKSAPQITAREKTSKAVELTKTQSNKLIERFRPDAIHIYDSNSRKKASIPVPQVPSAENLRKNPAMPPSKSQLQDSAAKGKTAVNSPQNEVSLFHKRRLSVSKEKAGAVKMSSGKPAGHSNVSVLSPYLAFKKIPSSLPNSKEGFDSSTARVPNPNQSKEQITKENEVKVVPLSMKNVEKWDRSEDCEKVSKYIKEYFKARGEYPPTTTMFYRVGRLLGKGAFGKVSLGMHRLTGKLVAIKCINKQCLTDEASKQKVMKEFAILKNLRHPNIIRLYESFESSKHILTVTELCTGGDLLNFVRQRKRLDEKLAKYVFKRLVLGLNHCHSKGVLHRDIKLDNILLNGAGELKIGDFGVSRQVKKGELMLEQCGTPAYIAPEILRDKGYEGFAADIWSAGVALYAMLYGTVPFKANDMKDLHKLIIKAKYHLKEDISQEARDLLTRTLQRNPKKRISIAEILKHEWMKDVDESVSLFSSEEMEQLNKEYNYGCDRVKLSDDVDTLFTEHNVDSTMNELTKNNTSKSLILAPFNSSASEGSEDEEDLRIKEKGEMIRFGAKVKDIDRQYEKNNNGDVDNGVYNKFVCESSNDASRREVSSVESSESDSISYGDLADSRLGHYRTRQAKTSETTLPHTQEVVIGKRWPSVDKDALGVMEEYGFRAKYVAACVQDNLLNHATATYYLMTNHYF